MQVVARWLGGGRGLLVAVILALALAAPSLGSGLVTEDHVHARAVQTGSVAWPSNVNLFAYNSGDPSTIYHQKDAGTIPWLAYERYKISFWRPLASWTHYFDHRVLSPSAALTHTHSLLWLAALVLAVGALYRRLLAPAGVATLAATLYAVDDAHGHAIGWLANRNALMATTFGALALVAYDRWRRDDWKPGAVLAPALLALGLLSGELAVGAMGFVVAHVLALDRARSRWLAILPSVAVVAGWLLVYRALGHGTSGSGLYLDPLHEPGELARATLLRLPVLLAGAFGPVPSEVLAAASAGSQRWLVGGVLVALGLAAALATRDLASDRARFFAVGTLLSLLPVCTTLPADRLLFFPGIGAMALVAIVLHAAWVGVRAEPRRHALLGIVAAAALVVHGPLAVLRAPSRVRTMETVGSAVAALTRSALEGQASPDQILVLVNAPSFYVGALVFDEARDAVKHGRVLYGGHDESEVSREDDRTLVVRAERGFFTDPIDRLYRGFGYPMKAGDGLALTKTLAIVLEVNARGEPVAVRYRFPSPLESGAVRFVVWRAGKYEPFVPPPIGEPLSLPQATL